MKKKGRIRRRHREAIRRVGIALLLAIVLVGGFIGLHLVTRDPNLYAPPPDD